MPIAILIRTKNENPLLLTSPHKWGRIKEMGIF
jgi:hypothetical protein